MTSTLKIDAAAQVLLSGYNSAEGICWQFRNKGDRGRLYCKCPACSSTYGKHTLAFFGRCRSGRRWFWSARTFDERKAVGFADSENEAMAAAMAAVRGFRDGIPLLATVFHGWTSRELKEFNKGKRAARPPSSAKDSRAVEYLYGYDWWNDEDSCPRFIRFCITKRTARRVYYLRRPEVIDEHGAALGYEAGYEAGDDDEPGFVDRQKLEAEGHVRQSRRRHWSDYSPLYASLDGLRASLRRNDRPATPVDLAALKAAMVAAHPDKGGSHEAFITARQAYEAACRRRSRAAAPSDQGRAGI